LIASLGLLAFHPKEERVGNVFANNCVIKNTAFKSGEKISMTVYYAVAGVYVNAGTATFTNTLETLNGKPVYHIVGEGRTNSSYVFLYRVRDRYETFIDTTTLQPMKFIRNVDEGGHKIYQNVTFNKTANTAISNDG